MSENHYSRFIKENSEQLTFRDYLAIDRTLLANERSFLAYVRTAVTVFIGAISLIKFFDEPLVKVLGEILLAGSVLIFIQGLRRYKSKEHVLTALEGIKQEVEEAPARNLRVKVWRFSQELVKVFYK